MKKIINLYIPIIFLLPMMVLAMEPDINNLSVYFEFDNDINDSIFNINLTASSSSYNFIDGIVDNAINITSPFFLSANKLYNYSNATTWDFWLYINNTDYNQAIFYFAETTAYGAEKGYWYNTAAGSKFRVTYLGTAYTCSLTQPASTWTHYTVFTGPEGLLIYQNTTNCYNNTAITQVFGPSVNHLSIGSYQGVSENLTGMVDNIALFTTRPSTNQLQEWVNNSYNNGYGIKFAKSTFINCSHYLQNRNINFTSYNEDNKTFLNSNIALTLDIINETKNFSYVENNVTSFKVCAFVNDNLSYNAYLEYQTPDALGRKERYYLENSILTDLNHYIDLYNFPTSTTTSVLEGSLVYRNNYQKYTGVIAKLRRYFPATNEWRTVQVDKSDEFGKVFFYIHQIDTKYDMIFEDSGTQIYKTNELKFICDATTGICSITFPLDEASSSDSDNAIDFTAEYDNTTGLITTSWNDPTLLTHEVRVEVVKNTPYGLVVLYNQTSSSTSGSLIYNASAQTGFLQVRAFSTASPENLDFIKYIEIAQRKLYEIIESSSAVNEGKMEAMFWSFGLALTAVGAASFTPVAAVVALLLAFIVIFALGTVNFISMGMLVLMGIVTIILIIKARN